MANFFTRIDHQILEKFRSDETIKLRLGAGSGWWCIFLVPAALVLEAFRPDPFLEASKPYQLTAVSAAATSVFLLHRCVFDGRPAALFPAALLLNCVLFAAMEMGLKATFAASCCVLVTAAICDRLVVVLLRRFPWSFSLGEALVSSQLVTALVFAVGANLAMTDGILALALGTASPVSWLEWIWASHARTCLVVYWATCSAGAVLMAGLLGGARPEDGGVNVTVVRKYFHGVVVAVYVPGIWLEPHLLRLASAAALVAFLVVEAVRLSKMEPLSRMLNFHLSALLDEKDQGALILTPIYLLVGCSLPLWIACHIPARPTVDDLLLWSSGVLSLGVGDAAASVGGTLFGRTKIRGGKSLEGTACSVAAQVLFATALLHFGLLDWGTFPWTRFVAAASLTSVVEALTSQVDNLVLPLVMFVLLRLL